MCTHSQAGLSRRYNHGSMIVAIAIFSSLFFLSMLFYLKKYTLLNQIEWDVSTTTASDYTIDMKITTS